MLIVCACNNTKHFSSILQLKKEAVRSNSYVVSCFEPACHTCKGFAASTFSTPIDGSLDAPALLAKPATFKSHRDMIMLVVSGTNQNSLLSLFSAFAHKSHFWSKTSPIIYLDSQLFCWQEVSFCHGSSGIHSCEGYVISSWSELLVLWKYAS